MLLGPALSAISACGADAPALPSDMSPVAVHELITGPDGAAFLASISTYSWEDGGAAAAELFEWIKGDATSADTATATRAGETANVLARFLSDNGDELLDMSAGFLNLDQTNVGQRNPDLVAAYASALTPFQGRMVCDHRTTVVFELIKGGCDPSILAAGPIFEVLSTNQDAYKQFSDAIYERIDRYVQLYADNDPTSTQNPYPSMLAYSGRLLGLLTVGARKAGIAPPDMEIEVVNVNYVLARAILDREPSSAFPSKFVQDGRILSPTDAERSLTAADYSEYKDSLVRFLDQAGNVDDIVDDAFIGQYEFAADLAGR